MPDITGTTGNDTLTGTSGDDNINPNGGIDTVDGQGGIDTIYLNYGGTIPSDNRWRITASNATGTSGTVGTTAAFSQDLVTFSNVESIDLQATGWFIIDGRLTSGPGTIHLTGLGSDDRLELNLTSRTLPSHFSAAGATATVEHGSFDGFEAFTVFFGSAGDFAIGSAFNDLFIGNGGNDELGGLAGADSLYGNDGDDRLDGGLDGDLLFGGTGEDTLVGGDGADLLHASDDLSRDLSSAVDTLSGGNGDDRLVAGFGDIVEGGEDFDIVSLDLATATGALTINLTDAFAGSTSLVGPGSVARIEAYHTIIGSGFDDIITIGSAGGYDGRGFGIYGQVPGIAGGAGNDTITGGNGGDLIDGGTGNDTIFGLGGNDSILGGIGADLIDGGADADTISAGDGNDRVMSGDSSGVVSDQSAHDQLDAGAGDDWLVFGHGDNAEGGTGYDIADLSYTGLTAGVSIVIADILAGVAGANGGGTVTNVEAIARIDGGEGDDTIDLRGAALYTDPVQQTRPQVYAGAGNDLVIGSDTAEILSGGFGNDIIFGNGGDDMFDGRLGNDQLHGGSGNDVYRVDSQDDLIFEDASGGIDQVFAHDSFYLYDQLEQLFLTDASGDVFGVGNSLDNLIFGNGGSNLLIGAGGNDVIRGDAGNDLLFGEADNDQLYGDAGIDYLVGGQGADQLFGGDNADALYGGDGDDSLDGGDSFDTDILVGGDGNDTLDGDSGQANADYDLMDGGSGDDQYLVDSGDDLTFEAANGGYDWVFADVKVPNGGVYLWANVEALTLVGTTAFGVGNELDNFIRGNASGNWLLGGAGNDQLRGDTGNDVLFGEAGADWFMFGSGDGQDVIADFVQGTDKIYLEGIFSNFAQVQAAFHQNGADGAIDLGGGNLIVLQGVTLSSLTADDFIFMAVSEPEVPAKAPTVMDPFLSGGLDPAVGAFADHDLLRWHSPLHDQGWLL